MRNPRLASMAMVGSLALLAGCGRAGSADSSLTGPPVLTTISVSVSPSSIQIGQRSSAVATMLDQNGTLFTADVVRWSTASPAIATISVDGALTGVAPGQTRVVAMIGDKQGEAALTVLAPPGPTVTVTPAAFTLPVGRSQQLVVVVRDPGGTVLDGQAIVYMSDNLAVATVTSTGLVNAVGPGSAGISATGAGATGTARVTVSNVAVSAVSIDPSSATINVGQHRAISATARDDKGNVVVGRQIVWTTNNAAVATVTTTGGVTSVTGIAPGTAQIMATCDGVSATAVITVGAAGLR
ncbi:MAG TPA: Ig-like domain-containing protein [Gemmatimonadaceae bacterium]|nr:Ig-like domain-containing protein [Gemmatimonadaceae bacterium]